MLDARAFPSLIKLPNGNALISENPSRNEKGSNVYDAPKRLAPPLDEFDAQRCKTEFEAKVNIICATRKKQ